MTVSRQLFPRKSSIIDIKQSPKYVTISDAYLEPSRTSTMERFRENSLLFSQKSSIVDFRLDSKYAYEFLEGTNKQGL